MIEVAVGIDIGGTFTKYGIVDTEGNCLVSGSVSTTEETELDKYLHFLKKTIEEVFDIDIQNHSLYFYGTKKNTKN